MRSPAGRRPGWSRQALWEVLKGNLLGDTLTGESNVLGDGDDQRPWSLPAQAAWGGLTDLGRDADVVQWNVCEEGAEAVDRLHLAGDEDLFGGVVGIPSPCGSGS